MGDAFADRLDEYTVQASNYQDDDLVEANQPTNPDNDVYEKTIKGQGSNEELDKWFHVLIIILGMIFIVVILVVVCYFYLKYKKLEREQMMQAAQQ